MDIKGRFTTEKGHEKEWEGAKGKEARERGTCHRGN